MTSLSAAILVATWTATFGLHSSSSTTSSYWYFVLASAFRSLTARSAELRPPRPLTDTPPVSGPMKPTLTLSLAPEGAAPRAKAKATRAHKPVVLPIACIGSSSTRDDSRGRPFVSPLDPCSRRRDRRTSLARSRLSARPPRFVPIPGLRPERRRAQPFVPGPLCGPEHRGRESLRKAWRCRSSAARRRQ